MFASSFNFCAAHPVPAAKLVAPATTALPGRAFPSLALPRFPSRRFAMVRVILENEESGKRKLLLTVQI